MRRFMAILLGVVLFVLLPVRVFADDDLLPVITLIGVQVNDKTAVKKLVENVNAKLHDKSYFTSEYTDLEGNIKIDLSSFFIYDEDTGDKAVINIKVDTETYSKLPQSSKQEVMQIALDEIVKSKVSRTNRNKIYNELCALDPSTSSLARQLSETVRIDFYRASKSLRPFSGFVGWVLGVVSILIFAFLGLGMIADISFITIPFIQNFLLNKDENKAKFISLEAVNAVKESASKVGTPEYKSAINFYVKDRTKQIIAVVICLLYLTSGNIYTLLGRIMDYFSGLLR